MNRKSLVRLALFLVLTVAVAHTFDIAEAAPRGARGKAVDRANVKIKERAREKAKGSGSLVPKELEVGANPRAFIDDRVGRVLRELKGRPPRTRLSIANVDVSWTPTRQEWLQTVYQQNLVDASNATALLSDKLLFFEVARRELGDRVYQYLPKTRGLKETLMLAGLVGTDGQLKADGDAIEATLFKEFPSGFVARPAVGVAPRETGRGLFAETDLFIEELVKPGTFLYRPEHAKRAVRSTVLDQVASGEAIVLQEDLIQAANAREPLKKKYWREVRVHTYEGRVLGDATPTHWVRELSLTKDEVIGAQAFVQEFLSLFPAAILSRQAWSFDVLVLDNGEKRIVDLVTNRGRRVGWSSYLDQPRILGAYTRHFEQFANIRFAGLGGTLLRHDLGHYFGYWGVRIDRSRPGLDRVLAWIPPWP